MRAHTVLKVVPRFALELLSWPYAAAVTMRNSAFDRGLLRSTALHVPVISVGNLTVGGTGKTPLVEYIVRYLLGKGKRVAVVSRGYKRSSRGIVVVSDGQALLANAFAAGDEPVQIAKKFPRALVVVGNWRAEASRTAVEQLEAEVVVLDDGFQHRYLQRNLDVVVVDSRRASQSESMLPAGRLREPWQGIRRAQVVALSKVDEVMTGSLPVMSTVRRWYDGLVIQFRYKVDCVCRAPGGNGVNLAALRGKSILAVSGIGDPGGFIESLRGLGLTVSGNVEFPDHHFYSLDDVQLITQSMHQCGAEMCITTEKDIVRMMPDRRIFESLLKFSQVHYTCISVEMVSGEHELLSMIDGCLVRGSVS